MSVLTAPVTAPAAGPRPTAARRGVLALSGILACALPVVFAVDLSRMLLVGELSSHRLHHVTGQGLLLAALWLAGLVPQVRAGWVGRAPGAASVLLHVVFVATGVVCTLAAPLGGAPFLLAVIVATGLLLQAALPIRGRLRSLEVRVAPAVLTASLALAAVAAPYVVGQLRLQHAATGHHAANPHFFDMAWLVSAFVMLALVSALVASARSLLTWAAGGAVLTGTAMLMLGQEIGTGWGFVVTGLVLVSARLVETGAGAAGARRARG